MRMPQDFVDAVNEAVRAVDPSYNGTMTGGSISLGSDFDRWVGPEAMMKWGLGPMPPEEVAGFNMMFEKHREALKKSVVDGAVQTRMMQARRG